MTGPQIFTPQYYARMRALESDGWWNAAMRDVAAMLLRDARLPPTGTMLDVGCGSGQTALWFQTTHPGWRVTGLDIAYEGLRAAHVLNVNVTRSSALALPHRDQSMDAVVSLDVIQHLPLPSGDMVALSEMRRVLRPEGVLLLRTNAQAFPRTMDDPAHNFHRYEPGELRRKLEANGFRVSRLSRVNALLGVAEIPREWKAARGHAGSYHGILAKPGRGGGWTSALKRSWLRMEGRAVRLGMRLPAGRTIIALCHAE